MFAPALARVRPEELRRQRRAPVEAFPLHRAGEAAPRAVELLSAELSADRRETRAGEIIEAVRSPCGRSKTGSAKRAWSGDIAREGVDVRREPVEIYRIRQRRAADDIARVGSVRVYDEGAIARLEVRNLQTIRAGVELRIGKSAEQADPANARVPVVADQQRTDRRPFLAEVAVGRPPNDLVAGDGNKRRPTTGLATVEPRGHLFEGVGRVGPLVRRRLELRNPPPAMPMTIPPESSCPGPPPRYVALRALRAK